MSHFTVMVIGPDYKGQLQPFHEFECTGEDDQYVQEIDKTDEAREEYQKATSNVYRTPTGELCSQFDEKGEYKKLFLREPTPEEQQKIGHFGGYGSVGHYRYTSRDFNDGRGYRSMIVEPPEGYVEVEVPTSQVESFADWAKGWYGTERRFARIKHRILRMTTNSVTVWSMQAAK